ncbi:MAG: SDR family oxidoreductase [Chloroflexi bacterium]|nr:SDR family oxidoreductase [Chloroflexota bacterium]
MNDLKGRTILVTGAARRVGRIFALACGRAGANVIIHHGHSPAEAESLREEIASLGPRAWVLPTDLSQPDEVSRLISRAGELSPLYALVNSASIFEPLTAQDTTLDDWDRHLAINLTAPFLLCQAFAKHILAQGGVLAAGDGGGSSVAGRIVNILDWRALRPGADHFPYTVTKAALAAMTQSLAVAFAPHITVNGLALGAILPPADNPSSSEKITASVPAQRWSEAGEVEEALLFFLSGPAYITGEIIHLDGGRHLI